MNAADMRRTATTRLNKYRSEAAAEWTAKVESVACVIEGQAYHHKPLVGHVSDVTDGGEERSIQLSIHPFPLCVSASSSPLLILLFLSMSIFLSLSQSPKQEYFLALFFTPPHLTIRSTLLFLFNFLSISFIVFFSWSLCSVFVSTGRFLPITTFFLIYKPLEFRACKEIYLIVYCRSSSLTLFISHPLSGSRFSLCIENRRWQDFPWALGVYSNIPCYKPELYGHEQHSLVAWLISRINGNSRSIVYSTATNINIFTNNCCYYL